MDNEKIAKELVEVAKELVAADKEWYYCWHPKWMVWSQIALSRMERLGGVRDPEAKSMFYFPSKKAAEDWRAWLADYVNVTDKVAHPEDMPWLTGEKE